MVKLSLDVSSFLGGRRPKYRLTSLRFWVGDGRIIVGRLFATFIARVMTLVANRRMVTNSSDVWCGKFPSSQVATRMSNVLRVLVRATMMSSCSTQEILVPNDISISFLQLLRAQRSSFHAPRMRLSMCKAWLEHGGSNSFTNVTLTVLD